MAADSDTAVTSPFRSAQSRSEERAVKRQALLTAAVQLFNERGFHATSLDDVAASVGVTKPVVYHYLGNKDQVLFECVDLGLAQLRLHGRAPRLRDAACAGVGGFRFHARCMIRPPIWGSMERSAAPGLRPSLRGKECGFFALWRTIFISFSKLRNYQAPPAGDFLLRL